VADIVTAEMKLDGARQKYAGGERGWVGDNKLVELSLGKIMKQGWRPATTPEDAIRMTTKWTLANC
jgi:hypothetical protein